MKKKRVYLVSVSGGKDSQACWIYMLKNYSHKGLIVPYFCDTGWEKEETYNHLKYLEKELCSDLTIIKSKKYDGFEDMCIQKKIIPSRIKRFCTEELKIKPSNDFIKEWIEKGYDVVNVVGVRKDESKNQYLPKAKIKNGYPWKIVPRRQVESKWKFSFFYPCNKKVIKNGLGVNVFQPIVNWSAIEVLKYNISNGTKNNPLYSQGRSRVGCEPCISCTVGEIGLLTPETVLRVSNLEKNVSSSAGRDIKYFHRGKGIQQEGIEKLHKKYAYNTLDMDLGCINQYGICE